MSIPASTRLLDSQGREVVIDLDNSLVVFKGHAYRVGYLFPQLLRVYVTHPTFHSIEIMQGLEIPDRQLYYTYFQRHAEPFFRTLDISRPDHLLHINVSIDAQSPVGCSFLARRVILHPIQCAVRMWAARRNKRRVQQCLSIAMALHPRLGHRSPLKAYLNEDNLRLVAWMLDLRIR